MTTPGGSFTPQFSYADLEAASSPPVGEALATYIRTVAQSDAVDASLAALQDAINAKADDAAIQAAIDAVDAAIAELQATGPGIPSQLSIGGTVWARADVKGLFLNAPVYADNAAALAGGLLTGHVYKTASGEARFVVSGPSPDQDFSFTFEPASITPDWFGSVLTLPDTGFSDQTLEPQSGIPGTITRDTARKYAGTASMKCWAPARIGAGTVPKASMKREGWLGQPGATFTAIFYMYLESGPTSWNNLLFFDLEIDGSTLGDPALAGNFFGTRIGLNSSRAIKLDREFSSQADPLDVSGRNVPFPLDQWVKVEIVYYCHSSAGTCTVAFNDVNVYTATPFMSLPTAAQINAEFAELGTAATGTPVISMAEVGITANGNTTNAITLNIDNYTCGLALP